MLFFIIPILWLCNLGMKMKLPLRNDRDSQQSKYRQSVEVAKLLHADEHLLGEPVAAMWLQMHPDSLLRLRKAGSGPRHCLIGRRICYRRSDLTKWIEAQLQAA